MTDEEKTEKICPRCKKAYIGYPALSRRDNTTLICSECGVVEALEDYFNYERNKKNGRVQ